VAFFVFGEALMAMTFLQNTKWVRFGHVAVICLLGTGGITLRRMDFEYDGIPDLENHI
jgi:hypothetical protein